MSAMLKITGRRFIYQCFQTYFISASSHPFGDGPTFWVRQLVYTFVDLIFKSIRIQNNNFVTLDVSATVFNFPCFARNTFFIAVSAVIFRITRSRIVVIGLGTASRT